MVCRGSYLSRFIGQEVAPGLSCERSLVAVASPGLFPQPLWISVRREANSVSVWHGSLECQGPARGPGPRTPDYRSSEAPGHNLIVCPLALAPCSLPAASC